MQYRKLGTSGIRVSVLCLGTWQFSQDGNWRLNTGSGDVEEFRKIVNYAIDAGVNFIDTAEEYGNSEEILGKLLRGRREDVVLATKIDVDQWDYATVHHHVNGSLKRLQTDHIDLYQIHWPRHLMRSPRVGHKYSTMEEQDYQDIHTSMHRLKAEGLIRIAGLSNFRLHHLQQFQPDAFDLFVSNQVPYSLLWRAYDQSDLLTFCRQREIGYLAYSSLAQGLLTGTYEPNSSLAPIQQANILFREPIYSRAMEVVAVVQEVAEDVDATPAQVALKWVIEQDSTIASLVGVRNVNELEENIEATTIQLKQDQMDRLNHTSLDFWASMPSGLELWDVINIQANLERIGLKPRDDKVE